MNRLVIPYIGPGQGGPAKAGHDVRRIACGGAALLGGAVYANALRNPFVYDDYHTVVENASILHAGNLRAVVLGAVTRPVVNFSYALDRAIWGPAPFGFHVTNVLLHIVNVILLFQLASRFEEDRHTLSGPVPAPAVDPGIVAFAAAALFAVHPMMTESVGYISGRSEVLCATFFMLAMLCGRRWLRGVSEDRPSVAEGPRGASGWAAVTVALWIAALASKETAAMFPFVFLAYDRLGAAGTASARRRRMLTVHLPLIGTAIAGGIIRIAILARIEYPGQVAIHWNYLWLALDVVRRYTWMMVIPSGQAIFHEVTLAGVLDWRPWVALIVVGAIGAVAWNARRGQWVAGFGLLWYLLALVPSSVLTALDQGEPMAEHRVYLASCGLFLAAGAAIGLGRAWAARPAVAGRYAWLRDGRLLLAAGFTLVLVSFGTETLLRNAVWADPIALWRESVDLAPRHYRPRLLLGESLQDAGRRTEAMEQYQAAIRLRPAEAAGYVKAGQVFAETGQWPEARRQFLKAIDVDPRNIAAHHSLTVLDQVESRFGIDDSHR